MEDFSVKVSNVVSNRSVREFLQVVIDPLLIVFHLHEVIDQNSNCCKQIAVNWIWKFAVEIQVHHWNNLLSISWILLRPFRSLLHQNASLNSKLADEHTMTVQGSDTVHSIVKWVILILTRRFNQLRAFDGLDVLDIVLKALFLRDKRYFWYWFRASAIFLLLWFDFRVQRCQVLSSMRELLRRSLKCSFKLYSHVF